MAEFTDRQIVGVMAAIIHTGYNHMPPGAVVRTARRLWEEVVRQTADETKETP